MQRGLATGMAGLLLLTSCAAPDGTDVATGPPTPVVTTPPLALPPVLDWSQPTVPLDTSTTVPLQVPGPTPTSVDLDAALPRPTAPPGVATTAPTTEAERATPVPTEGAPQPAGTATAETASAGTPEPTGAVGESNPPVTRPASGGATIALGDFDVVNLRTASVQNVAELSPSGPTLLWFWAPHSSTCNLEAPLLVQFARDHPEINVVAVGSGTPGRGDTLDGAYTFASHHGLDTSGMTVFYDESFRVWRTFGVSNQPWVVLFDGQGQMFFTSQGRIDFDSVAAAFSA